MPVGYSIAFADHIKKMRKQHPNNPLFELGSLCIEQDVAITTIAERMEVSKQAVYDWLYQQYEPKSDAVAKIKQQVKKLKAKQKKA